VCFTDVVRAEFGIGGQVLFTRRDGGSSLVDLSAVSVADRDAALTYVRTRLPIGSCVDIVLPTPSRNQLLHVAWNFMLWLVSAGLVQLGYALRAWAA
jgi:hypothetical protein